MTVEGRIGHAEFPFQCLQRTMSVWELELSLLPAVTRSIPPGAGMA